MNRVWKIGSRWSGYGSWDSRIITIFRRSNVVFIGGDSSQRFHDQVKQGDYFAIADGYTVVSVARAISDVIPLQEMIDKGVVKVRDGEPFNLTEDYDGCYGVRVKIVDLPANEQLYYPKRGTFFSANMFWYTIKELYETKIDKTFDIAAKTYRLLPNSSEEDLKGSEKHPLIDGTTKYIVPIYQREYSWSEEQVSRFIRDIFRGFWGVEDSKELLREPMFIGTMQLSFKKYISSTEYEQDIIDGQQRISTFICLIKYLQIKFTTNERLTNERLTNIKLNWLETRVNNGKEDLLLNEMLVLDSIDNAKTALSHAPNRYIENLLIIDDTFSQITTTDKGEFCKEFENNFDSFLNYLFHDIYMVVVETVAGLSKTIQIFNTINTTGLPLNGDDLFKVRLYEYFRDKQDADENVFNEIGNLYKKVKDINEKWIQSHNYNVVTMSRVRSVYKDYLIARYNLPNSLYQMSTDTFYECLFDVLLNVQEHKEIKNTNGLVLSLEEINEVIDSCILWKSHNIATEKELINSLLIKKSRYGRYESFAYQVILATKGFIPEDRISFATKMFERLSRIFFVYSIIHAKQVNEIHSFMNGAFNIILSKGVDATLEYLNDKLDRVDREYFKYSLGWEIAYNRVWKDLICSLSAYFDESAQNTPLSEIEYKLSYDYDIEHIHATADEDMEMPESIQNSIGNLMLLEYDINRSIGCETFKDKVNGIPGHYSYKDSNYATAKKISLHSKWDTDDASRRKEEEINKIMQFIFQPN